MSRSPRLAGPWRAPGLVLLGWLLLAVAGVTAGPAAAGAPSPSPWAAAAAPRGPVVRAVALPDGRVLGLGQDETAKGTAQIYDPRGGGARGEGSWSPAAGPGLANGTRAAVLLQGAPGECAPNCGKVLVHFYAGDWKLFDPAADRWTDTGAPNYHRDELFTFALLIGPGCAPQCGKVLVAGGLDNVHQVTPEESLANAVGSELYDPKTNSWALTGEMAIGRVSHRLTRLADGRVLVAGGNGRNTDGETSDASPAELYDPGRGAWAGAGRARSARVEGTYILLADGRVLVFGGYGTDGVEASGGNDTTELYDPATNRWTLTDPCGNCRASNMATLLPDGKVLTADGFVTQIYDPSTGKWAPAAAPSGYAASTATFLGGAPAQCGANCGKILFAGQTEAQLYSPAPAVGAVDQAGGPAEGGTTLTITGTGFTGDSRASLGDQVAQTTFVSPTELKVVTPPGAGAVPLTVTTPGGTAEVTFTYAEAAAAPETTEAPPATDTPSSTPPTTSDPFALAPGRHSGGLGMKGWAALAAVVVAGVVLWQRRGRRRPPGPGAAGGDNRDLLSGGGPRPKVKLRR